MRESTFSFSLEYADNYHAMAQHAQTISNSHHFQPLTMSQIPMLSAAGLNLTVPQHHLSQVTPTGHHGKFGIQDSFMSFYFHPVTSLMAHIFYI